MKTRNNQNLKWHSIKFIASLSVASLFPCVLILFALFMFAQSADAATLKSDISVDREHIVLGDVFDGVKTPNVIIGKAPALGKEIVINAQTLNTLAQKHNLEFKAATGESVTVQRASYTLVADDVVTALKEKLQSENNASSVEIVLNDTNFSLALPTSVSPTIEVKNFALGRNGETFTAEIAVPNAQNPIASRKISGLLTRSVSMPVLKRTLKRGDIISASDIDYIEQPERLVTAQVIVDADELIGQSPARVITAGRVIKDTDITAPKLVNRGDEVLIKFEGMGGMVLTAKGKAAQHGALGEFIRVTNLSSAKALTGEVSGTREVTIR